MDGDSPGLEPFVAPSNCVAASPDLFSSEDEDTSHSGKSHVMSCLPCICLWITIDSLTSSLIDIVKAPVVYPDNEVKVSDRTRLSLEAKDSVCQLESARLQRLLSLLQGVPPPPSVTIPQITLSEVLHKLRENSSLSVASDDKEGKALFKFNFCLVLPRSYYNNFYCLLFHSEPANSLWKPNSSLEDVLKTEWPEIRNLVYHDMQ